MRGNYRSLKVDADFQTSQIYLEQQITTNSWTYTYQTQEDKTNLNFNTLKNGQKLLKMVWRKFEELWSLSIRISCQNLKTLNISRDNRQKLKLNMSPKKFVNHDVLCSLARPQIPILHKILTYLTKKINSFPSILKIWARLDHFLVFFVCLSAWVRELIFRLRDHDFWISRPRNMLYTKFGLDWTTFSFFSHFSIFLLTI